MPDEQSGHLGGVEETINFSGSFSIEECWILPFIWEKNEATALTKKINGTMNLATRVNIMNICFPPN
jgi:hypothetical protein